MSLNPLEQVNLIAMAAIAAIFLLTLIVLRKVFFLPLIDVMERRSAKLERAHATDTEANALLDRARAEAGRIETDATAEAGRFSKDRDAEFVRIREQRISEAAAEAEAILARGRQEVSHLSMQEHKKLQEQLLVCSRQTLVKMIGEVDEEVLRYAVNRVLSAREAAE